MMFLRQSTAATVPVGPFENATDGVTPQTSLSDQSSPGNARLITNGVGAAFTGTSWAHDGNGVYLVGLSAAHTASTGVLRLNYSNPSTYVPVWEDFTVLPPNVYDSLIAGSSTLNVNASSVWDVLLSAHQTSGTMGAALNALFLGIKTLSTVAVVSLPG